jgi:hypothetical protein
MALLFDQSGRERTNTLARIRNALKPFGMYYNAKTQQVLDLKKKSTGEINKESEERKKSDELWRQEGKKLSEELKLKNRSLSQSIPSTILEDEFFDDIDDTDDSDLDASVSKPGSVERYFKFDYTDDTDDTDDSDLDAEISKPGSVERHLKFLDLQKSSVSLDGFINDDIYIPNDLENTNQNIIGVNEMKEINNQQEAWNRLQKNEQEFKANRIEGKYDIDLSNKPDAFKKFIRPAEQFLREDEYERNLFNPGVSELAKTEDYYNSINNPSESKIVKTDDVKIQMRDTLVTEIAGVASESGVPKLPENITNGSIETLKAVAGGMGISPESVKTSIASSMDVDVDEIKNLIPNETLEIIEAKIPESVKPIAEVFKSIASSTITRSVKEGGTIPNIQKKINNIIQSGGNKKDIKRMTSEDKGGGREEKHVIEQKRDILGQIIEDEDTPPPRPPKPTTGRPDEDAPLPRPPGPPRQPGPQGPPPVNEQSYESQIADQINNINKRLEDLSMGKSDSMKYPEQKPTKKYRFPRPNENYSAVSLIQNSTTNFLNDMNMYGDTGSYDLNIFEI